MGKPILDATIAVLCFVLTVFFDFVTSVLGNAEKIANLQRDHSLFLEFLAKPFDLWAIGFAVIIGAAIGVENTRSGKVVSPAIAAVISLILILASEAGATVFPIPMFRMILPDLFAVAFVGYTLNRVKA